MSKAAPLDGVQMAILNKRLEGVCRKMANTLFRTGRSGVLNTARDFPAVSSPPTINSWPLPNACRSMS